MEKDETSEGFSEDDFRALIGTQLDEKFKGVATKDDIGTAIGEAFKSLKLGGNESSGTVDKDGILAEVRKMFDEVRAEGNSRKPGWLTKALGA